MAVLLVVPILEAADPIPVLTVAPAVLQVSVPSPLADDQVVGLTWRILPPGVPNLGTLMSDARYASAYRSIQPQAAYVT
jgi:hypothetical protein